MTQGADQQLSIEQAVRDREERGRLLRRRDAAAQHVQECEARVAEARRALQDEAADVAALESFSWTRLAAAFAGTRDSELMREKAEAEAAQYAVASAEVPLAAAHEELAAADYALAQLGDVDAAHARAPRITSSRARSSMPMLQPPPRWAMFANRSAARSLRGRPLGSC